MLINLGLLELCYNELVESEFIRLMVLVSPKNYKLFLSRESDYTEKNVFEKVDQDLKSYPTINHMILGVSVRWR